MEQDRNFYFILKQEGITLYTIRTATNKPERVRDRERCIPA